MPLRPLLSPGLLPACLIALGLLLAAGGAPAPAAAQTVPSDSREAMYLSYYHAVAAYERCRKATLSEEAHSAIARYVERQGASSIGTKRLLLIQQAKKDLRAAGCNSQLAAESLARFDAELQPLIP